MSHLRLTGCLFAMGWVLGCGAPAPTVPVDTDPSVTVEAVDAGGAVGAACTEDAACQEGLNCIKELPGGFCTRPCAKDCPGTSICVNITKDDGSEFNLCGPVCENVSGCRTGYECVSVGRVSVCGF
jgi:hypothetical protein